MASTALSTVNEIVTSLVNIQASRYTCGAAMTLMFYDFFLTLPDEIQFIWSGSQKITPAKIMFIWNRYMTMPWIVLANYHLAGLRPALSKDGHPLILPKLADVFRRNSCKFVIVSVAIIQGLSIMVGIQLLALRVLALYKNDRKVRIGLFSWLAVCHIALTCLVFISMAHFVPFLMYLPLTNSCYSVPDALIGYVYIPPLLAEAGILILQAFHHFQIQRTNSSFQTTLLSTLYRDGYLYFAAVMSLRLLSIFIYAFAPPSLWFVSNQMDFPISTALVSRFFLQLRGAVPTAAETTMPTGSRNRHPSAGIQTISFGLPIHSIQDDEETYLQLRRIKPTRKG